MPTIAHHVIPHDADEEPVMRRLAKAIAVQWDILSEIEQEAVIAQATMIQDEETTQLRQQIKQFVDKHKDKGKS